MKLYDHAMIDWSLCFTSKFVSAVNWWIWARATMRLIRLDEIDLKSTSEQSWEQIYLIKSHISAAAIRSSLDVHLGAICLRQISTGENTIVSINRYIDVRFLIFRSVNMKGLATAILYWRETSKEGIQCEHQSDIGRLYRVTCPMMCAVCPVCLLTLGLPANQNADESPLQIPGRSFAESRGFIFLPSCLQDYTQGHHDCKCSIALAWTSSWYSY